MIRLSGRYMQGNRFHGMGRCRLHGGSGRCCLCVVKSDRHPQGLGEMPGFLRLDLAPRVRDAIVWGLTHVAMGLPAAAGELPLSARAADPTSSNAACATAGEFFPRRSTLAAAALFASPPGKPVTSSSMRVCSTAFAECEWDRLYRISPDSGGTAGLEDGPAESFITKSM
jgi:hypothetical protein